jgi:exodeoxyribonuclease I
MAEISFFWHDYETTGIDARRHRPAQFAGLRTDAELNPIGEPVMLYCQPPADGLPDPQSVLLTGITPQHCAEHGLREAAFAQAVEHELARPGTVGVGYNSIRFDDEFTRHLFWRCLMDPYAREWADGCSRWDLIDTVRCAWALRPEGLVWPRAEDGRVSFRLEDLARANGLAHESAHDALSDVRATVALARLLRTHQPRLWEFCLGLRDKRRVQAELLPGQPLLHLSSRYAQERGHLALVWIFGPHPVNRNEVIAWDLAQDPEVLMSLSAQDIRQRLFTRQDALPEGVLRLPIKTIHLNKSPVVMKNLSVLTPAQAERYGIDRTVADAHAQKAARISGDMVGVWVEVFARPAPAERPDVDEDLYGGFLHDDDRRLLTRLRRLPPDELAAAARLGLAFRDARLDELLFRYRARNQPETLDDEDRARWVAHCHHRLLDDADGSVPSAMQRYVEAIDALALRVDDAGAGAGAGAGDERSQALLEALVDWGEQLVPEPD